MYVDYNGNYRLNIFSFIIHLPVFSNTLQIKLYESYPINVKYSVTTTINNQKGFYNTVNNGNDFVNNGIGYSNSLGSIEAYSCDDKGVGVSVSNELITKSMEFNVEEGLTISSGIVVEEKTHEFSFTLNTEFMAITTVAVALACSPIPYGRIAAALTFAFACCILVVSNLNI